MDKEPKNQPASMPAENNSDTNVGATIKVDSYATIKKINPNIVVDSEGMGLEE